jgi:chromosome partitioning protein
MTNTVLESIAALAARLDDAEVKRAEFLEDKANDKIEISKLHAHHSVPQTQAAKICGMSLNNFKDKVNEAISKGIIPAPTLAGNKYLYTLNHLHALLEYFGAPKWRDDGRECIVCNFPNAKGGTGKTTTVANLAVKIALELRKRAKVLIIDLDPQGSIRDLSMSGNVDTSLMLSAVDLMLSDTEHCSDLYKQALELFDDHSEVVKSSVLSTHICNLDVLPAFPEDERFTQHAFLSNDLNSYLKKLNDNVIAHIKDDYDFIYIDSGPHNNPLVWAALDACNAIFIPVSPRKLDWNSTKSYIKRLDQTLSILPSKGSNLKLFKIGVVNYDDEQDRDLGMLHEIKDDAGRNLLISMVKRSSAFEASARQYCTVMDLNKVDSGCPPRQIDKATQSLKDVSTELYQLFHDSFPKGVR